MVLKCIVQYIDIFWIFQCMSAAYSVCLVNPVNLEYSLYSIYSAIYIVCTGNTICSICTVCAIQHVCKVCIVFTVRATEADLGQRFKVSRPPGHLYSSLRQFGSTSDFVSYLVGFLIDLSPCFQNCFCFPIWRYRNHVCKIWPTVDFCFLAKGGKYAPNLCLT